MATRSRVEEVHILWITAGLGCDGDCVSITAQASIEDVLLGAIPGLPKVQLHNPVLASLAAWAFIPRSTSSSARFAELLRGLHSRQDVECHSTSSIFRGYSLFMQGKDPRDAHFITSRICGICGDNHATCSVYTQNMAYGVALEDGGDSAYLPL